MENRQYIRLKYKNKVQRLISLVKSEKALLFQKLSHDKLLLEAWTEANASRAQHDGYASEIKFFDEYSSVENNIPWEYSRDITSVPRTCRETVQRARLQKSGARRTLNEVASAGQSLVEDGNQCDLQPRWRQEPCHLPSPLPRQAHPYDIRSFQGHPSQPSAGSCWGWPRRRIW